MKIESSVTGRQFRFYDDDGKYLGSVRGEVRGPRLILDSLESKHFYKNIDQIWEFINVISGTSVWHCHVVPSHYLVIQRLVSKRYKIELLSTEKHAGREMCWLEITKI